MEQRLVTPEAVQLDLQTATVATRALARLLDTVIQWTVIVLLFITYGAVAGQATSGTVAVTLGLLAVFVVRIGYPTLLETRFGGTLGHMAMGLRIVTLDGGAIRFRQALVRAAIGLLEIEATSGFIALVVAGARGDGRRLGDLAAGTVAVSVRHGTGPALEQHHALPPSLAGWAAGVDPRGLQPDERVVLRRYHERAASLPPDARRAVAVPLVERLCRTLAVPVPPVDPHTVLVAIAAVARTAAAPPSGSTDAGDVPSTAWAAPSLPTAPSGRPSAPVDPVASTDPAVPADPVPPTGPSGDGGFAPPA